VRHRSASQVCTVGGITHFTTVFRRIVGMSPAQYRRTKPSSQISHKFANPTKES
jgi:AraC-like DNA-binding protein